MGIIILCIYLTSLNLYKCYKNIKMILMDMQ